MKGIEIYVTNTELQLKEAQRLVKLFVIDLILKVLLYQKQIIGRYWQSEESSKIKRGCRKIDE